MHLSLDVPDGQCPRGRRGTACREIAAIVCSVCANCGARDQMEPLRLREHGTVHIRTIVHRSYPA